MELINKFFAAVKADLLRVIKENSLSTYGNAIIVLLGTLLFLFVAKIISTKIIQRPFFSKQHRINKKYLFLAHQRLFSFLFIIPFYWSISIIKTPAGTGRVIEIIFYCLFLYTSVKFLSAITRLLVDFALKRDHSKLTPSTGKAIMPIANILLWAIALTFFLDNLGFQVSTISAGLGIMGVAVGLAGQAILGDFFSYLVILVDRPYKIGDFVTHNASGLSGSIEHIGLKTTRMRASTGELLVCNNSSMTTGMLMNFDKIKMRRVRLMFPLPFGLTPAKIEEITERMRNITEQHEHCVFIRAVLVDFGPWSMNFELMYDVKIGDMTQVLAIQHDINLKILSYLEDENIELATTPSSPLSTGKK